jgi:segregation and condensation protein B
MLSLDARLEAVLFAAAEAVSEKRLAEVFGVPLEEVKEALGRLASRLEQMESGLRVLRHGLSAELVTLPEAADDIRAVLKAEVRAELSRPSLEALAILAYRGPLTRPELEQIRGVQSSLILRNLLLRGLIEMKSEVRLGQPVYGVTADFLKYLGLASLEELPDFAMLHQHPVVQQVLQELEAPTQPALLEKKADI